ncbi:MAG TPA: hypothetical protein VI911_08505 [Patescibacteria group bacterium]|nr:hypothetical protein [Patescibacteria group bacterium]
MNIGVFNTCSLSGDYTGVYAACYCFLPLLKELKKNKHTLHFYGELKNNKTTNTFLNTLKIKNINIECADDFSSINDDDKIKILDAMLIYNRPPEMQTEFEHEQAIISKCVSAGVSTFILDGDLWSSSLPKALKQKITLLRPYTAKINDAEFKNAAEYNYFTSDLSKQLKKSDRIIDYLYIGNFYNRFDEFKEKFKDLKGNIVVAGNWLKNAEKAAKSIELNNVLYIGEISHAAALPLYNIAKNTFYIIPQKYKDVGMLTSRVYEAAMAGCNIDVNTKKLNTVEQAYAQFINLIKNDK